MLKEIKKATSAKVVYLRHKEQFIRENLIPGPNEFVFLVEDNGLAIFNFLLQIAFEQDIVNLQIESFRISKRDLLFLEELIKIEKIPPSQLILSDSIPQMVVGTYNYLKDNPNFKTKYVNTHAKMCFIETKQGNYYSILSSGNFNPDGKLEQLTIINNQYLYEFNVCLAEKEI